MRILGVFICILGLSVNGFLMFPVLPSIVHGDNDFMGFYAGAKLAGSSDLYNLDAMKAVEAKYWQRPRAIAWVRLPFYALMISPLRFFSYEKAYWVWQSLSLAALALFIYSWPTRNRWFTAIAFCWSLPLLNSFIMGQDVMVAMLALSLSIAALFRGKPFMAGCIFSLCLIKYNLFLPIPLLIIQKRAWRFAYGVVAGGLVLLAISFLGGGWSWPVQYLAILRLPTTTPHYGGLPNLHGLYSNQPHSLLIESATACLVALAAWLGMNGKDMGFAIAAALLSGLLLSYHAFFADAVMAVPAGLLLLERAESLIYKVAALALLCPLTFLPFLLPSPFFHPAIVFLGVLFLLAVHHGRIGAAPKPDVIRQPQEIATC
jgi:hypothetical protein